MAVHCKAYQAGSPQNRLRVRAVLFGGIDHRLDVFRLGFVKESPVAYEETAILTDSVDQILDVVFDFLGSSQTQLGGRYVAEQTGILPNSLLDLDHIRLVDHPQGFSFRDVLHHFHACVPIPLSRREWDTTIVNQAQHDLFQSWPIEFLELFVGDEAIRTLMEGDEDAGVAGYLCAADAHTDHERHQGIHGLEQLIRLSANVQHDSLGTAQGIADDIERRLGEATQ